MRGMKFQSTLTSLVILFVALTSATAVWGCEDKDDLVKLIEECQKYNVVYKPHPSFYKRENIKLDYRMTIKEPPEGIMRDPGTRWDDYFIHVYKYGSEQELSRYRMSSSSSLGASITTIGGLRHFRANPDLSPAKNARPFAYIIPTLGVRFYYQKSWEQLENNPEGGTEIEFFTDERTPPDASAPEVWMFSECTE